MCIAHFKQTEVMGEEKGSGVHRGHYKEAEKAVTFFLNRSQVGLSEPEM